MLFASAGAVIVECAYGPPQRAATASACGKPWYLPGGGPVSRAESFGSAGRQAGRTSVVFE
ncbi:hypothetical protein [Cohnella sp. JJ-181]|uniref:hypothetical protein n=1 Tax=Cohnella rhizoplanae TaxID=2974897 RepID=UPI002330FC1A|nr:hypothetical protein [Cohnella sp. JJ-181]